jgi:hypothetical protein
MLVLILHKLQKRQFKYCFTSCTEHQLLLFLILYQAGYSNVNIVEEQRVPDGSDGKIS